MKDRTRSVRPFYVHRFYIDRGRVRKLLWYVRKYAYQAMRRSDRERLLIIVGSQRSGTTMLSDLFDSDIRTRVYGEFSRLSAHDSAGIRLNALPSVRNELRRWHPSLSVMKPLVESQNARTLLDGLPASRAVWMYRDHRDVVSSRAVKFGTDSGHSNLTPIRSGEWSNWRADGTQGEIQDLVEEMYRLGLSEADELALFWYVRNAFYFSQRLDEDDRVRLCLYEDLVADPECVLRFLYGWLDLPYRPLPKIAEVNTGSLGKGSGVRLSPHVAHLCQQMQGRLDSVYDRSDLKRALGGSRSKPHDV